MRTRLFTLTVWALASVACGVRAAGPPDIEVDRTACAHCRMLVSEPRFAAASRAGDADARVFDDIGCLLASTAGASGPMQYWFQDAAGGGWIDGADAIFVRAATQRTPMSGGIVAFRSAAAADALAGQVGRASPFFPESQLGRLAIDRREGDRNQ